jgi:hypothetical protein
VIDVARRAASALVPPTLRTGLRDLHRARVFRRAMRRLCEDPAQAASDALLDDLMYGWGNESWAARREFLQACMRETLAARQPILECGSGLTTLVLGALAQKAGTSLWAIEHLPDWAMRVRSQLQDCGIRAAKVVLAPLRDYGSFDWYDLGDAELPAQFGLVLCDGPPSQTRGGRYGMVPIMRERLVPGCVILLDDAERPAEREIARRWADELGADHRHCGREKPFIVLTLGDRRQASPSS